MNHNLQSLTPYCVRNNNRGTIGIFTVDVTAYVDAIENAFMDIDSELRYPPSSNWHINYYQLNGIIHGGAVPGAVNVDVKDEPWGAGLGHTEIDNDPNVIEAVSDAIEVQLPQR